MKLKSMLFVHLLFSVFCAVLVIGALVALGDAHVLLGLIGATAIILSHCAASFYTIETSIQIKRAVKLKGLDPAFNTRHEPHKRLVFPTAFSAMVSMIIAAILGGATDSGAFPAWSHGVAIWIALPATLVAWGVEGWAISGTRRLLAELNAQIETVDVASSSELEQVGQTSEEAYWILGRWMTFLGISLWGIYGYLIIVIQAQVSILPYVVLSFPLVLFGFLLQKRFAYQPEDLSASS